MVSPRKRYMITATDKLLENRATKKKSQFKLDKNNSRNDPSLETNEVPIEPLKPGFSYRKKLKKLAPKIKNLTQVSDKVNAIFEQIQDLIPDAHELEESLKGRFCDVEGIKKKLEERENKFLDKISIKLKKNRNTVSLPELNINTNKPKENFLLTQTPRELQHSLNHQKSETSQSLISLSATSHSNHPLHPNLPSNDATLSPTLDISISNTKNHYPFKKDINPILSSPNHLPDNDPHESLTTRENKRKTLLEEIEISAQKDKKKCLEQSTKESDKLKKIMADEKKKLAKLIQKVKNMDIRKCKRVT